MLAAIQTSRRRDAAAVTPREPQSHEARTYYYNKLCNYSNSWEIFMATHYISVYIDHSLWINKYRLLIDHTFVDGSNTVDIYDSDF